MWSDMSKMIQNKKFDFPLQVIGGGVRPSWEECKKLDEGNRDGWRFGYFLTDGRSTNPTQLQWKTP